MSKHTLVHVSGILSGACIFYKWLCFHVLHCIALYRVQQNSSICISSPGCLEASAKAAMMELVPLGSSSCCTAVLYCSRYYTVRLKMFYFLFLFFKCITCVKSTINLLQYSTTQPTVLAGYLRNFVGLTDKLNLGMCSQNRTSSYVGDLLYTEATCLESPLHLWFFPSLISKQNHFVLTLL